MPVRCPPVTLATLRSAGPTAGSRAIVIVCAAAKFGSGIRRRDPDGDVHREMIFRRPDPPVLQRNRLARLAYDRDAHEILICDQAARRIEI
jgi:hypothetical protein